MVEADFQLLESVDNVFAYQRQLGQDKYLVVVNLSDQEQAFKLPEGNHQVIISNTDCDQVKACSHLQAWDAFCLKYHEN